MQVTINDVRLSVKSTLEAAYPTIPVWSERVNQVQNASYFFVQLLHTTHTQELGRRFRRVMPFKVEYHLANATNQELYDMGERLSSALNQIVIADRRYMGQSIKFEVVEQVLCFYVTYSMLVWEQEAEAPIMQSLEQEDNIYEQQ